MAALTKKQLDDIRELHSKGVGRNQISRTTGIDQRTVSEAAAEMGLSFTDAARTQKATQMMMNQNAERRQRLMEEQLQDALKFREQLWAPCTVGQFGGRDNTWSEVELKEPPFQDKLRLQQSITGAVNTVLQLLKADAGSHQSTINLVIATAEKLGLADKDGE